MKALLRSLLWCSLTLTISVSPGFAATSGGGGSLGAYRFFEGNYGVSGQQDVHYTIYAPLQPALHDAILFLHGYLKSADDWYMHQEAVAGRGVIGVAIDYHEEMGDAYILNEVVTAISLLDDWWEVRSISFCGSSFGGEVAFETLAKRPDLGIAMALLIYPSRPDVSPQEVAAVNTPVLNLVGEVDSYFGASLWLTDQVAQFNPDLYYRLHVYSAEDFPETARHGFFFPHPGGLNEVGEDSFVRSWGFFEWGARRAPAPPWRTDPTLLLRDDLLTFGDL